MTALHGTAVLGLVPLPPIRHLLSPAGERRYGDLPATDQFTPTRPSFDVPPSPQLWAPECFVRDHKRDASVQ